MSPSPSCEAPTISGAPCRRQPVTLVDVPGHGPATLCGGHANHVRHRGAMPTTPPPPAAPHPPWSAEEDAILLAHPDEPAKAGAPQLGRSVYAVQQRRAKLRRTGRLGLPSGS